MAYLKEENDYWRTPEFLKFTGTTEYRILKFLLANIVRDVSGSFAPSGAWKMYKDFFKKGLLCASYSQDDIAGFFGFFNKSGHPNGAYISRLVKRLEQMGLLKIHKIRTPGGLRNVYELGQHNGKYGKDGYEEKLYFDQYFGAKVTIHKLEKEKQQREQIIERNTPGFVDELNGQIGHLENELLELSEMALDSFR